MPATNFHDLFWKSLWNMYRIRTTHTCTEITVLHRYITTCTVDGSHHLLPEINIAHHGQSEVYSIAGHKNEVRVWGYALSNRRTNFRSRFVYASQNNIERQELRAATCTA
jgi:hypothetical protein